MRAKARCDRKKFEAAKKDVDTALALGSSTTRDLKLLERGKF